MKVCRTYNIIELPLTYAIIRRIVIILCFWCVHIVGCVQSLVVVFIVFVSSLLFLINHNAVRQEY